MSGFSDERIISSIQLGGLRLEKAMEYLYLKHGCRREVFVFIRKRGGSKEDAEDIFQDGIRFLIMQVRDGKYKYEGQLGAYLFGICKNLWFRRFKKISRNVAWEPGEEGDLYEESNPELDLLEKDRQEQIRKLMAGIGEACRKVLELWQLSYSMKEIAREMGYKTEGVARKKKHICLKKLLDILKEEPAWKTWLGSDSSKL